MITAPDGDPQHSLDSYDDLLSHHSTEIH